MTLIIFHLATTGPSVWQGQGKGRVCANGQSETVLKIRAAPGKYLFHAHKVEFSEKGWVGIFLVNDNEEQDVKEVGYGN